MQLTEQTRVFASAPATQPDRKSECKHCGLAVPAARQASGFCCHGCEAVFALLEERGLDRFYDLGGGRGHPVGATPEPARREWLAELEQQGTLADGRTRLVLDVQGIHCAACVWVLQELWRKRPGAIAIRVNPALGQADLTYRRGEFALEAFLDDVERLGYRVAPASKRSAGSERGLLIRMGICVALAMNAMMFAVAEYLGLSARDGGAYGLFRGVSFGLATLAVVVGGPVFFKAAWAGLRRRVLHLDLPIALGIALAWSGSAYAFWSGRGEPYFDTVTVFTALMLVGRYLQERSVARNREYLLADDGFAHLRVRRLTRAGLELVGVDQVAVSDTLLLTPGDLLPVTARVLDAQASFSLDWINGESEPRAFAVGDAVPAGAFQAGRKPVRVTATADVRGSGLLALLARSASDRDDLRAHGAFWLWWNRLYVAAVLLLAASAALVWAWLDPSKVVPVTVALLVVTCPCALGIATPLAFDLAVARLRRRGVLVCSGGLLEKVRHVRHVVLDKTGTVTWGRVRVDVVQAPPAAERDTLLTMAAANNHPVSRAIVESLGGGPVPFAADGELLEVPGAGVELRVGGRTYRLGSSSFALGASSGAAESVFSLDGVALARFAVREDLRDGFAAEVQRLTRLGRTVHLLSGDKQDKVDRVADVLGVPRERARGEMQPEGKADYLRGIDADDTMMLGDGLNDAPAFAAAYVAGTPALDRPVLPARADFCYVGGRPDAVSEVVAVGEAFHRTVATNLKLGLAYNGLVVTLSVLGLMNPVLCAILMPVSSLVLVGQTTLRLRVADPARPA